jgi:hypothetical protein
MTEEMAWYIDYQDASVLKDIHHPRKAPMRYPWLAEIRHHFIVGKSIGRRPFFWRQG